MRLKKANDNLASVRPGVTIERANYGRGDRYAVRCDGCDIGRFYTISEAYTDALPDPLASDGSPRVLSSCR